MTARPRRLALPAAAVALVAVVALASTASAAQKKAPAAAKKPSRSAKPRDYARTLVVIKTPQGDVTVKLFAEKAPNHVKSFVDLAASAYCCNPWPVCAAFIAMASSTPATSCRCCSPTCSAAWSAPCAPPHCR